ncbi:putative malate dehydrogenase 1B [Spodoptera frugiperda]|uniref:Malate dehydrogenase 1B n=1 Tax=Spodoptera frugiperda TaxID=7108 RepID=A0A2H1WQP3_SPOFR|nr:putative malate dehydrogenase 1B [Spodoptera frugiperda]XP_050562499.1 putative malate dehydrogenase 1B [Spodoptera frugiperda]
MGFRIIIAGETQCSAYAETCLLADYLSQNLPNFCFHCIEKSVMEWKSWLCKVNMKNKWHHKESPIVWKELLMKGSKAQYIGGASEFLDYCYSYYNFDALFSSEKYAGLLSNILQFKKKLHLENILHQLDVVKRPTLDAPPQKKFVITISGAGHLLAMHLISSLVDHKIMESDKTIHKIYLYDERCTPSFMNYIEKECSYVQTDNPGKDIKCVSKIGVALTSTDVLIILDHVPFDESKPMGTWLQGNRKKMKELALMINASGSRKMYIIFPNLGPACYNATILRNYVNINKNNIVVATSDVGMEILPVVAKVAQVPMRNIFCPPVWGFVGINKLVDIQTTIHMYNTFNPYKRYTRVRQSSLNIGSITPERRPLDYLMHFNETLWMEVAEMKKKFGHGQARLSKAIAVISLVNLWLLNPSPDHIVCLGICCDGSFGLNFDGIFSQPARFVDGRWEPATDFLMPKDRQMKLPYLIDIAKLTMTMAPEDLPEIHQYVPCSCKQKTYTIKEK